jgi:hypothetical protein
MSLENSLPKITLVSKVEMAKRIAELEAELAALRDSSLNWGKLMNNLMDELAALKARRCLECKHYVGCPIFTAAVDQWRERPTDFECSRWEARP